MILSQVSSHSAVIFIILAWTEVRISGLAITDSNCKWRQRYRIKKKKEERLETIIELDLGFLEKFLPFLAKIYTFIRIRTLLWNYVYTSGICIFYFFLFLKCVNY